MMMFTFSFLSWKHLFLGKFGTKTPNMDAKNDSNLGQSTIRLMIKLRSRLLRLAAVTTMMTAGGQL